MPKSYSHKIVESGNIIELYEYKNEILYDFVRKSSGRSSEAVQEQKEVNRQIVISRNKTHVKRLINANFIKGSSRLITYTFRENIQDLDFAHQAFAKQIRLFCDYMGFRLKYIAVIEFQERGAIHYHCVFFNLKEKLDLDKMREMWPHGSVNVKRLIKGTNDVGFYLTSYMCLDEEKLRERKAYYCSLYLKKPIEEKKKALVDFAKITAKGFHEKYSKTFENEYNNVQYTVFAKKL